VHGRALRLERVEKQVPPRTVKADNSSAIRPDTSIY
jgi:hypothetical protein